MCMFGNENTDFLVCPVRYHHSPAGGEREGHIIQWFPKLGLHVCAHLGGKPHRHLDPEDYRYGILASLQTNIKCTWSACLSQSNFFPLSHTVWTDGEWGSDYQLEVDFAWDVWEARVHEEGEGLHALQCCTKRSQRSGTDGRHDQGQTRSQTLKNVNVQIIQWLWFLFNYSPWSVELQLSICFIFTFYITNLCVYIYIYIYIYILYKICYILYEINIHLFKAIVYFTFIINMYNIKYVCIINNTLNICIY